MKDQQYLLTCKPQDASMMFLSRWQLKTKDVAYREIIMGTLNLRKNAPLLLVKTNVIILCFQELTLLWDADVVHNYKNQQARFLRIGMFTK